ncbi:hypothetical protein O181_124480 [Austropuccinia psidii MF-1]|uniref:Uncharacterized protein n=1 Tax=Austropuccinia psidii MF-1 TaxID=1389203 RepID=A0A9Q3Q575_9BASI|nr:hypothetical protein [Austropuccinia psidii MF-1]
MEHGQQDVQSGIPLGRKWRKLQEDIRKRDTLQTPYVNHQMMESTKTVQTPGGEARATRIIQNQAIIQTIDQQLKQTGPTMLPLGSKGVEKPNHSLGSHHSGISRSLAKSHHFSKFQVDSRRRQGYKGEKKTSFRKRKSKSEQTVQKLLDLVKKVHKLQKKW